jgi:prepilin-type N-terminal cleavage/methylation domain-containing protein
VQRITDQGGFTILELMLASAIFGLVLLGATRVFSGNQQVFASGQGKIEAQQNARIAVETIARELRVAGRDLRGTIALQSPATAIQSANASSLTFLGDIDNDDVLDEVTYRISGTQLLRDFASWNGASFSAATTGVLAGGVSSLTFNYYDGTQPTNVEIAAPVPSGSLGTIRRIQIGVVGSQGAAGGTPQVFSIVSDVRPRNL